MKFPLTQQLLAEAETFSMRSACRHCYFHVSDENRCGIHWPMGEQARWPLDAPKANGEPPTQAEFCKEFELG